MTVYEVGPEDRLVITGIDDGDGLAEVMCSRPQAALIFLFEAEDIFIVRGARTPSNPDATSEEETERNAH